MSGSWQMSCDGRACEKNRNTSEPSSVPALQKCMAFHANAPKLPSGFEKFARKSWKSNEARGEDGLAHVGIARRISIAK